MEASLRIELHIWYLLLVKQIFKRSLELSRARFSIETDAALSLPEELIQSVQRLGQYLGIPQTKADLMDVI